MYSVADKNSSLLKDRIVGLLGLVYSLVSQVSIVGCFGFIQIRIRKLIIEIG